MSDNEFTQEEEQAIIDKMRADINGVKSLNNPEHVYMAVYALLETAASITATMDGKANDTQLFFEEACMEVSYHTYAPDGNFARQRKNKL